MGKDNKNIGIMGGTFDPVHYGHLLIAEDIGDKFNLNKIIFIPSGMPPHKDNSGMVSVKDRFAMVCEAIKTNNRFEVSAIETERKGYSYTVDTLKQLKEIYKDDTELFLITGADVIPEIQTWKSYKELFALCQLITVMRPGYEKEKLDNQIQYLKSEYNARINLADSILIDISSTNIRQRLKQNRSIKYLVPESVETYIVKNGLYE